MDNNNYISKYSNRVSEDVSKDCVMRDIERFVSKHCEGDFTDGYNRTVVAFNAWYCKFNPDHCFTLFRRFTCWFREMVDTWCDSDLEEAMWKHVHLPETLDYSKHGGYMKTIT